MGVVAGLGLLRRRRCN
nr:hypothetical protein [Nostoc flagelliforme]